VWTSDDGKSPYVIDGVCDGKAGYPVKPGTHEAVCPPYKEPAVFFAPHPDDETLGMGGAIRRAVLEGRTVVVELMTRGTGSGARYSFSVKGPDGKPDTMPESPFGDTRVREFLDALQRLGVTAVHVNDNQDGALTAAQVRERTRFWTDRKDPGLALTGTAGKQDYNHHPDHMAVYKGLVDTKWPNTTWLMVYQNRNPKAGSSKSGKTQLEGELCNAKRNALRSYRLVDPERGRLGIGWLHSTGDLFDGAYANCVEYTVDDHNVDGEETWEALTTTTSGGWNYVDWGGVRDGDFKNLEPVKVNLPPIEIPKINVPSADIAP
jgi:LmbE family N-acetylglucosaminyl deacetylase